MKPGFALDLANEGLRLLARRTTGWVALGHVDFDDPEVEKKLAALRGKAETLAPGRVTTKLILPASQILYTEIDAPGPDRAARRAQIAAALEGRTPYPVKDLVFDWSRIGPEVHAAVIARVTLEEAEAFAETHGFNPVAFVARPEPGQFAGEPFFGETSAASTYLPTGERLDRDQDPVRVIDAEEEEEAASLAEAAAEPDDESIEKQASPVEVAEPAEATEENAAPPEETSGSDEPAPAPSPDEEAQLETSEPASEPEAAEAAEDQPADETETAPAEDEAKPEPAAEPNITAALPPDDGKASDQSGDKTPERAPTQKDDTIAVLPAALAATLAPEAEPATTDAPFIAIEDLDDLDDAPIPEQAANVAFATRRPDSSLDDAKPAVTGPASRLTLALAHASPDPADHSEAELSSLDVAPADQGVTAAIVPVPQRSPDNQPDDLAAPKSKKVAPVSAKAPLTESKHGTQAQRKALDVSEPAAPTVQAVAAADPISPRPSVFSATRAFPEERSKLKPSTILGSILALLLLAVALWWMLFKEPVEDQTADLATPAETAGIPAATPVPDTVEGSAAETAAASLPTEPSEKPLTSVEDNPVASADDAAPPADAVAEEPVVVAPPAETIWDDAPETATNEPSADAPGAPQIARAVAVTERPGALTRPEAPIATIDAAPKPQPLPPPFGTTFEFLPDGTIRPTEDGVVTPDGFTLIAGPPPVVPAPRPGSVAPAEPVAVPEAEVEPEANVAPDAPDAAPEEAAPAVEGTAPLPEPVNPAHAAKKPRVRPAEVVARAAQIAAEAEAARQAELEAQRALEEAIASATPQAVASSQRPKDRPSGLARPVDTAVAAAVDDAVAAAVAEGVAAAAASAAQPAPAPKPAAAPKPEPVQEEEVDEPEPVAPTPNIPTTVTVARQATIKNAINLRDVSLIGVYGSSKNRRALVRLPTGRMIKVKVGDRLDGGKVAAIGDSDLSYVKRGKTVVLKILKNG